MGLLHNDVHGQEPCTSVLDVWFFAQFSRYHQHLVDLWCLNNSFRVLLQNYLTSSQLIFRVVTSNNGRATSWQATFNQPVKRLRLVIWQESKDGVSSSVWVLRAWDFGDCPSWLVVKVLSLFRTVGRWCILSQDTHSYIRYSDAVGVAPLGMAGFSYRSSRCSNSHATFGGLAACRFGPKTLTIKSEKVRICWKAVSKCKWYAGGDWSSVLPVCYANEEVSIEKLEGGQFPKCYRGLGNILLKRKRTSRSLLSEAQ